MSDEPSFVELTLDPLEFAALFAMSALGASIAWGKNVENSPKFTVMVLTSVAIAARLGEPRWVTLRDRMKRLAVVAWPAPEHPWQALAERNSGGNSGGTPSSSPSLDWVAIARYVEHVALKAHRRGFMDALAVHDHEDDDRASAALFGELYVATGFEPEIVKQMHPAGGNRAAPSETARRDEHYLIWAGDKGQWWGPDRVGYVEKVADAGRYTAAETCAILERDELREHRIVRESTAREGVGP